MAGNRAGSGDKDNQARSQGLRHRTPLPDVPPAASRFPSPSCPARRSAVLAARPDQRRTGPQSAGWGSVLKATKSLVTAAGGTNKSNTSRGVCALMPALRPVSPASPCRPVRSELLGIKPRCQGCDTGRLVRPRAAIEPRQAVACRCPFSAQNPNSVRSQPGLWPTT